MARDAINANSLLLPTITLEFELHDGAALRYETRTRNKPLIAHDLVATVAASAAVGVVGVGYSSAFSPQPPHEVSLASRRVSCPARVTQGPGVVAQAKL